MNDPYGLDASQLPPELIAQLTSSKGQRAIAEAMMMQSMKPIEVQQPKGRFQGAISPLEAIAKVIQGGVAKGNLNAEDARMGQIAQQQTQGRESAMADYQKSVAGTPATPMIMDDFEGAPAMKDAVPGDRRAAILKAMTNPYMPKEFLKSERDDLNKDEARADQQKFLAAQRKDQFEQNKWQVGQRHLDKLDEIARAAAEKRITDAQAAEARAAENERHARLVASLRQEPDRKPNIVTDAAGNVTFYDNQGNVIKKEAGVGKPSAAFEKNAAAKKQLALDLDSTISELESLTKDGGLIDKSTGSGIGAGVDWVAAQFGKATPGAVAAGRIAPIFDKVLKMVPRFEGPQSDKDTQSYKEAAGNLANPAIPNPQKKAAAQEILRLMKARKGQFVPAGAELPPDAPAAPAAPEQRRVVDW